MISSKIGLAEKVAISFHGSFRAVIVLAILFAVSSVLPVNDLSAASFQKRADQDIALEAIKKGEILSYAQVKKIAQKHFNGRVVGQKLHRTNEGWMYDLRVRRSDGVVVHCKIDAAKGAIKAGQHCMKPQK